MPAYHGSLFIPPAPLAKLTLRYPQNEATVTDTLVLLDSGTDVTSLPQSSVDRLGISINLNEGYELIGLDRSVSIASVAQLNLFFSGRALKNNFC